MRRLIIVAIVATLAFTGCQNTGNVIGSVFNPLIGTWTSSTLGVKTEMVFNVDKSTTETVTILGVTTTKNGTWNSNGTNVTRTWADGSIDAHFYSFSSNAKKLTFSDSSDGMAINFDRSR